MKNRPNRLIPSLPLVFFSGLLFAATPKVTGDIDKDQAVFEKSLVSDPQNKETLFMLGLIYEKKGKTADALRIWRRYLAVETEPQSQAIAEKHIHLLSQ